MEDGVQFPVDGPVYIHNPAVFINGKQTNRALCHSVSFDAELDGVVHLFFIVQLASIKPKIHENHVQVQYNLWSFICIH